MNKYLKICCLLIASGVGLSAPATAGHELGIRAGGFDDFYVGGEWQTPVTIGPALLAPSLDFSFGDFDAAAFNGDLRWDLMPLFDTGLLVYGKAGPTLIFGSNNTEIGLSLTIAAEVGLRKGRSLQFEWRFGLGDIPESKIGLALMFSL